MTVVGPAAAVIFSVSHHNTWLFEALISPVCQFASIKVCNRGTKRQCVQVVDRKSGPGFRSRIP